MKDLIYRQEAIDAVEESRRLNHHTDRKAACDHENEHRHFLNILNGLPPADRWIPCSEKEAEYPCLACDVFGQIFITNNGIVKINGECYDGTGFDFSNAEEFLKGIKVGNSMRMLPRKIVAWSPLPEPYKGEKHG